MELHDFIAASAKEGDLLQELTGQQPTETQLQEIEEAATLKDKAVAVLKTVKDPELPLNIWELGLVYDLRVENGAVEVDMTLTAPTCPVAGAMPAEVEKRLRRYVPEAKAVEVKLVWEPRWNKEMMSEDAKLLLDMW